MGSWNISHWTSAKAQVALSDIEADILALQETHLAKAPLEWAHGTAKALGLHLHHGHCVPEVAQGVFGRSCGVGFLCKHGLALASVVPQGAAWRRLHAQGRLHAVRLEKSVGLPQGLLLLSVYAPLQVRDQQVARAQFTAMVLEVSHTLDMQIPTLLMGDFNGSMDPPSDFLSSSGHRRPPCPLLSQLLGPGGAWVDVHRALLKEVPWTFRSVDKEGTLSASRIDLVLANHAAMPLVQSASVLESVQDGGHSPVLVHLVLQAPVILHWSSPRARLPPLLSLSSTDLRSSLLWQQLVEQWQGSAAVKVLLERTKAGCAAELSQALVDALSHVVDLAGGWQRRPEKRRAAYDSDELRAARRALADLCALTAVLERLQLGSTGSWPRVVEQLLRRLERMHICLAPRNTVQLLAEATQALLTQRALVQQLTRSMRRARHDRWKRVLPQLWQHRRGVVYHWLHGTGAPWGAAPIVASDGLQCTSPAAVDVAVREFWVASVLRRHERLDESACWSAFMASPFAQHIPQIQWPTPPWTGERVCLVLRRMREGSAPGLLGCPSQCGKPCLGVGMSRWQSCCPWWSRRVCGLRPGWRPMWL